MKIFVAGGAGYIGSQLVPYLHAEGHDVTVVDVLWFGNHLPKHIPVIQKDIFDLKEDDLWGYDAVIFLAGLSNDPMADYSPALNFIANTAAPTYLAYIAKKAGVSRYVYAGSCSVYGYTKEDELTTEESEVRSVYPYGISKLQGERGVMLLQDSTFSVVCLRQGTVCGYSPRMRLDLILNAMYAHALSTGTITVNNPTIWRPIFDIRDAVKVYARVLSSPLEVSGVFNVHSVNATVGESAEAVQRFFKKTYGKDIRIDVKHIPDVRNYRVSNEKAKKVLGVTFKGTLDSILEDLHKNIDDSIDINDTTYYNIKTFTAMFPDTLLPASESALSPESKKSKKMKLTPGLVSIGMPVYNSVEKIRPALESFLKQTEKNIEIILSDDASTDGTEALCRLYARKDKRIRYIRQKENLGQLRNIEFVMNEARGEYFVLGADDDWWAEMFVEKLKRILESNPQYGAAIASVRRVYPDGEVQREVIYSGELDITNQSYAEVFDKMSGKWPIHWFCGVYRTKLMQDLIRMPFPKCKSHDRIFMCELSLATHIYALPEVLHHKTLYRQTLAERYGAQDVGKAFLDPKLQTRYVIAMVKRLILSPNIPLGRKLRLYPYHLSLFAWRNRIVLREWFPRAFKAVLGIKSRVRRALESA